MPLKIFWMCFKHGKDQNIAKGTTDPRQLHWQKHTTYGSFACFFDNVCVNIWHLQLESVSVIWIKTSNVRCVGNPEGDYDAKWQWMVVLDSCTQQFPKVFNVKRRKKVFKNISHWTHSVRVLLVVNTVEYSVSETRNEF